MVCNNTAFGYMIISTMQGGEIVLGELPIHLLLLVIGGTIVMLLTYRIQSKYVQWLVAHRKDK